MVGVSEGAFVTEQSAERKASQDLLYRLNSSGAGAAWAEFLDSYSQLIINVAGQIEFEEDRIEECFLYVCEKLHENNFKRLLSFNLKGAAKFRTWLTTVVFNLCVDWHRHEYGRVRLLPAISALPEFDQAVYRLVIEEGANRESAYQRLLSDNPDLTRESLGNALHRIHEVLTPRQRWRISLGRRVASKSGPESTDRRLENIRDQGPGPESTLEGEERLEILEQALSGLPTEQRLLIHWKFQEGLSLKRIAVLADLGNVNQTWSQVQKAVSALSEAVRQLRATRAQKN